MKTSIRWHRAIAALALLMTALLGSACSDSPAAAPLAPFEPQINNIADNFEFQATGVTDVTWTFTYTWSNSGTMASVDQSTTVGAGSAVVTVYDAVGTQVYTQSLSANGTFDTSAGVAGNWTVKVAFVNCDGTVNFRVQKK
jgi:hypothetical protein